jgi:hypothetical protein
MTDREDKEFYELGKKMFDRLNPQIAHNPKVVGPVQEPVAWMVYTQEGQSVYVTDNPVDIQDGQRALPLYTHPPTVQPEPLEYWNAVEGWVKIDEVREHFDAVGCGTIYKTAGEDRTPLYTTPRPWVGLTDEDLVDCESEEDVRFVRAIEAKLKEKNTI